VFGPIIGGYVAQSLGWRWTNWLVMIFSSVGFIFACAMRETYAPTILRRKAARMRKETDDPRWWSRYDQKESLLAVLKVNLIRPFVMAVLEPIWLFPFICSSCSRADRFQASSGTSTSPLSMVFSTYVLLPTQSSFETFEVGLLE
jgi:MFS family permease